jgi:SAM-dependent methyltransferase
VSYERFSAPIRPDFPDEWYVWGTPDHFWLAWRLRVLLKMLEQQTVPIDQRQRILDIGCGRGALRMQLEEATRWTIDAADVNEAALDQAVHARGHTLLYDIHDRRPELKGAYDGIVLFDVLEHIQEDGRFLASACWHLKPDGWVVMNVPALPGLFSRYDTAVGHLRRYTPSSLCERLEKAVPEIHIQHLSYWGFSLLPIAWLRKLIVARAPVNQVIERGFKPPSKGLHTMLRMLMRMETTIIPRPPIGTSLMALACKH